MYIAGFSSSYANKAFGEVWQPKQRLMVGRDVGAMTQTSPVKSPTRHLVVANAKDIKLTSEKIVASAREFAQQGSRLNNFRQVNLEKLDEGSTRDASPLYQNDKYAVSYEAGMLKVFAKGENGKIGDPVLQTKVTENMRLVWDKDGEPVLKTGSEALSDKGVLAAKSSNEILIRASGVDVEAGTNSVVLNLSDDEGAFSGGTNVTYLGMYGSNTSITGGKGETSYAGYFSGAELLQGEGQGVYSGFFEKQVIEAGDMGNTFSGYFVSASIAGGNGENTFSGMFLSGSTVTGGDSDDSFNGRFIDSTVEGGKGNDTFGSYINENEQLLHENGDIYEAIVSDFIKSSINAGEGDDTVLGAVWGGEISLGDGDDTAKGVFAKTRIDGDDGDDTITAAYALESVFNTGLGEDNVALHTAVGNAINTDEGKNTIRLGEFGEGSTNTLLAELSKNKDTATLQKENSIASDEPLVWKTSTEFFEGQRGAIIGELQHNAINAGLGENIVQTDNGENVQTFTSKKKKNGEDEQIEYTNSPFGLPVGSTPEDISDYLNQQGQAPKMQGPIAAKIVMDTQEMIQVRNALASRSIPKTRTFNDIMQSFASRYTGGYNVWRRTSI